MCVLFLWLIPPTHQEFPAEFDATLQRLANADVQIESLKQQLDDAMGAEDMLVQLTERNLLLGEVNYR